MNPPVNPSGPDTPGPQTSDNAPGPHGPAQCAVNAPQDDTGPAERPPSGPDATSGSEPVNARDGAVLLDQVHGALARYVVLPSDPAAVAVALWIAASHAQPAWAHAPRLVVRGPEKRCGKSRLLDIVEALCWRPFITVNSSPAAVYRSIGDDDPPTLLVDEADTIFGPRAEGHEELRGLLNAGHQRNRPANRYDVNTARVEAIPTFAFAALAGIGSMPDTIEDRAVIIRMRRRAPGETVSPYRHKRDRPALRTLAAELHTWLRADLAVLEIAAPTMPVEDRAADTWEPLVAVADHAGGTWPDRARAAVLEFTAEGQRAQDDSSDRTRLLADIHTAFDGAEVMFTASLIKTLRADPEAPWLDYGGPSGLNPRRLAELLREYDIHSTNVRAHDGQQAKGFYRRQFADAWSRYTPSLTVTAGPDSDGSPSGTAGTPSGFAVPPSHPSHRRSEAESLGRWDGTIRPTPDAGTDAAVPPDSAVPGMTCEKTPDEGGTADQRGAGLRLVHGHRARNKA